MKDIILYLIQPIVGKDNLLRVVSKNEIDRSTSCAIGCPIAMNLYLPVNSLPSGSPILGKDLEKLGACFLDKLISTIAAREYLLSKIKTVEFSKFDNFIQTSRKLFTSLESLSIPHPRLKNWCSFPSSHSNSQAIATPTSHRVSAITYQLNSPHPPPLFACRQSDGDYVMPAERRRVAVGGKRVTDGLMAHSGRRLLVGLDADNRKRSSLIDTLKSNNIIIRQRSLEMNGSKKPEDQSTNKIELKRSNTVSHNQFVNILDHKKVQRSDIIKQIVLDQDSIDFDSQPVVRLGLFQRRMQPLQMVSPNQAVIRRQQSLFRQSSMDGNSLDRFYLPANKGTQIDSKYRFGITNTRIGSVSEDQENFNDRLISVNGRQLLTGLAPKKVQKIQRMTLRGASKAAVSYKPPKDLRLLTEIRKLISQKPKPYRIY